MVGDRCRQLAGAGGDPFQRELVDAGIDGRCRYARGGRDPDAAIEVREDVRELALGSLTAPTLRAGRERHVPALGVGSAKIVPATDRCSMFCPVGLRGMSSFPKSRWFASDFAINVAVSRCVIDEGRYC